MNSLCYFLFFRRKPRQRFRWDRPAGGLVMEAIGYSHGKPVADLRLAGEVLEQRYHCAPYEDAVIAEVFDRRDKETAQRLHDQWEQEALFFRELMGSA
jgi:hypothetical protein